MLVKTLAVPHNYIKYIESKLPNNCENPKKVSELVLDSLPELVITKIKDKIKGQIKSLIKLYTLDNLHVSVATKSITIHDRNMQNTASNVNIKIVFDSKYFICELKLSDEAQSNSMPYSSLFDNIVKLIQKITQEQINFNYNIMYITREIIKDNKLNYPIYEKMVKYLIKKGISVRLHTEIDKIIINIYDTKNKEYDSFVLKLDYILNRVLSMITNGVALPRKKVAHILIPIHDSTALIYLITFMNEKNLECIIITENTEIINQKDIEIYKSLIDRVIDDSLNKIYIALTTTKR